MQLPKYYQSITELPLFRFIDCITTGNLHSLVIEGLPDEKELIQIWDKIRIEYADAVRDGEYKMIAGVNREITRLEMTLSQMMMLYDVLKTTYVKQFADELNKLLGSSFRFDVTDYEGYEKDLKGAWNRSRGTKISLDLKRIAYEGMLTKYSSKDNQPTREYFQGILITLSDHARYPILETIMTWEFCERIRRLNEYMDKEKLKQNGRRSHR